MTTALTKDILEEMIKQEIAGLLIEAGRPLTHKEKMARDYSHQANVQRSQERERERRRKEKEEKEEVDEGCEGSAFHDTLGRFTNPNDDKGSYSIRDKSCKRAGQRKRPRASKYSVAIPPSKKPCGRGSKYLCKSGEAKWEEQLISDNDETTVSGIDQAVLRGIIQQELERAFKRKPSGCSVDYCAQLVNSMVAAGKGEMGKVKS